MASLFFLCSCDAILFFFYVTTPVSLFLLFFFFFPLSSVLNNMDRLSLRQRLDDCYELDTRLIQDLRLIRGLCLNFAW